MFALQGVVTGGNDQVGVFGEGNDDVKLSIAKCGFRNAELRTFILHESQITSIPAEDGILASLQQVSSIQRPVSRLQIVEFQSILFFQSSIDNHQSTIQGVSSIDI